MFFEILYCRFARTTKKITRVVLNKRSRQKALRKKEIEEKNKEKISNEIDRYFVILMSHVDCIKVLFLLFFFCVFFPVACPIS